MSKTLVIAEPGCTHEGDKATLIRLLETASACGADVWKPQWVSDPVQMCERRHIGLDHPKRVYYRKAYGWLSFPLHWHREFSELSHQLGMQYAVTCFLPQDIAPVSTYLDFLKISSFEARDEEMRYARDACAPGLRAIVSYGMADSLPWHGWDYTLQCVSAYPAPLSAMNLGLLSGNGKIDGERACHGLSDHSRHVLTGAVAVGAGAEVIEAHFRLDDCDPENPDYAVAFTPTEFAQYVKNIRDAETMLGDGVKRVQDCEAWALPYRVT